jgi:hypothetical protein
MMVRAVAEPPQNGIRDHDLSDVITVKSFLVGAGAEPPQIDKRSPNPV